MYAYYESMSGNPVFFHYTFLFSKVFLSGGKIGNGPHGHNKDFCFTNAFCITEYAYPGWEL